MTEQSDLAGRLMETAARLSDCGCVSAVSALPGSLSGRRRGDRHRGARNHPAAYTGYHRAAESPSGPRECGVMGAEANISHESFPAQGRYLGSRVRVVFHFDTRYQATGTVVRDDAEEPGRMIIRLDDGRHVLSTECQWTPGEAP